MLDFPLGFRPFEKGIFDGEIDHQLLGLPTGEGDTDRSALRVVIGGGRAREMAYLLAIADGVDFDFTGCGQTAHYLLPIVREGPRLGERILPCETSQRLVGASAVRPAGIWFPQLFFGFPEISLLEALALD